MSQPRAASSPRKQWVWPLFWLAWFGVPWYFGWFFVSRIECASCFREVLVHCLAFFGYIVFGGAIYSLSKPWKEHQTEHERSRQPHGYMLGTREDVILVFLLGGAAFAMSWFFLIYHF